MSQPGGPHPTTDLHIVAIPVNRVCTFLAAFLMLVGVSAILSAPGHSVDFDALEHDTHANVGIEWISKIRHAGKASESSTHKHDSAGDHKVSIVSGDHYNLAMHHKVRCDLDDGFECESMCQACSGALSIDFSTSLLTLSSQTRKSGISCKDLTRLRNSFQRSSRICSWLCPVPAARTASPWHSTAEWAFH